VTVRKAEVGEYAALGRLTVDAYRASGHHDDDAEYFDALRDPAARAEGCDLLVAVDGHGELLGGVALVHPHSAQREVAGPDEAEMRMLAVAPHAQGAGVGTVLVTACLERARTTGYPAVVLCVVQDNAGVHRLYRRFGFARTPERDWRPNPAVSLQAYRLGLTESAVTLGT